MKNKIIAILILSSVLIYSLALVAAMFVYGVGGKAFSLSVSELR